MQQMKIGLVIDTSLDTTEGVPQYVLTIGHWLRAQGHDVHYLAGETHRQDLPNLHSLARNIRVRFNGTVTTIPLLAGKKLHDFVARQDFDILHVQTPHHPFMAQRIILAAGPRTAVIATFHILPYGFLSRWGARLLRWWLQPSLKRIDTMLAVSPAAAAYEQQVFGLPAEVSPNTVDYGLFHAARPLPQYSGARKTILYLGRLVPRKGCKTLLEAVRLLSQDGTVPDFRVLVCSKGPMEAELKQYVIDNRLQDRVEFTGFVSEADKPRYYASADVAVFPSSGGESFGIVLLEAMAGGHAAVLAGDNPGYRSVMAPMPSLLFDPHSPETLANKLKELLLHESQRKAAADWGKAYAAGFDIDRVGKQLVGLYKQALHQRRNLP